ncbi:MAG: hypothetical protein H7321_03445 [Bacteroidia bacterium]|nr:hypothetical protein [Bacteroidia bacterium]
MGFISYNINNKKRDEDFIRISSDKLGKKQITGSFRITRFIDKDTNQKIHYIPALELTSYGDTNEKADEMMKQVLNNYFDFLCTLSTKMLRKELLGIGWKQDLFKNKDYSKAYIDINGNLNEFNVEDLKIENLDLQAA